MVKYLKISIFSFILLDVIVACQKNSTFQESENDSTKIVDSINQVRAKYNDSITSLNNKNHFKDFSGSHQFLHNLISNSGNVAFKKIGRDEYEVKGSAKAGKDYININGTAKVVSTKFINFTGKISQSISENDNGKVYTRSGTKTFLSKDGGKTWRLQDMMNNSGFIDYIDIKF